MAITTDRLLRGIKRRVMIAANQQTLSDSDLLELADDVMRSHVVPLLSSVREDYYVSVIQTATVADQDAYLIPERAVGQGLRELKLIRDNLDTTKKTDLSIVEVEDEHYFTNGSYPSMFYFRGDNIVLVPPPQTNDMLLELWIELAPGELTETANVGVVDSISGDDVTLQAIPATLSIGDQVDFVRARGGGSYLAVEKTITNIAANTLSFALNDVPTTLMVGDYIAPKGTSPVVQAPKEVVPYLETLTAARAMFAIGDLETYTLLTQESMKERENALDLLEPRIKGETRKIVNRNGLLRARYTRYRRGYRP